MEDYLKRPMTAAEEKYTFRQSNQISGQTGLIGYLRADFGTSGKEFYSSWEDWNKERKTPDFKLELDDVINCLREDGDILSSRAAMSKYCRQTPQSQMAITSLNFNVKVMVFSVAFSVYGLFLSETTSSGEKTFHFMRNPPNRRPKLYHSTPAGTISSPRTIVMSRLWVPNNYTVQRLGPER